MIKKITKLTLLSVGSVLALFLLVAISINIFRVATKNKDDFDYLKDDANKVILFIGDGMGQNHIANSELYLNKDLFFTTFSKWGYVNTYSKNTYWPTDSAAAATAMATGKKVYNTFVASSFGKSIKSISEIAKENGLGVGIVTTDTLAGATPAGFSAHAFKRSNTEEIILSQLDNDIDLYLGAGLEKYSNYKRDFENRGYTFIDEVSKLNPTSSKVLGSFTHISNYTSTNESPTLPMLTEFAIDYFETNFPDGYFLMIEGAHIDKSNHSNNIYAMMDYMSEFDTSIKLAYDKLGNNSDVAFIVTADHESGGLKLANNLDDISNDLYTTSKHTHADVYYFMYQKDSSDIINISLNIDNTNIFDIVKSLFDI